MTGTELCEFLAASIAIPLALTALARLWVEWWIRRGNGWRTLFRIEAGCWPEATYKGDD